ncbi:MAG: hypothetical protein JSR37_00245 [Verrucomicrobia bacterium]|nr:hypothetical protein [Verrucomicrobiota bacterium]MBS0638107.1 hypothetical protein [Verrucomicrobiota bacterium]
MKYLLALAIIIGGIYAYMTYGPQATHDGKNVSSGIVHYGKETLSRLEAKGFVTLDGTYVRKGVDVVGNLSATNSHLNSLMVQGRTNLVGSVVEGDVLVNGFFGAEHTTFRAPLVVSAQSITLKDCQLHTIVIKKPFWSIGQQVLELTDKSICKGSIVFESGNGKIVLTGNSQALGSVQGAEIEKR